MPSLYRMKAAVSSTGSGVPFTMPATDSMVGTVVGQLRLYPMRGMEVNRRCNAWKRRYEGEEVDHVK